MNNSTPLTWREHSSDDPELIAAMADNNTILQAIHKDRTYPVGSRLRSQEPSRSELYSKLEYLTKNFWVGHYRARTWGYTILRTSYRDGDDIKFQHGIDVINSFVRLWSDNELSFASDEMQRSRSVYEMRKNWPEGMPTSPSTLLNELFLSRFVNDTVEDKEALDGATPLQLSPHERSVARNAQVYLKFTNDTFRSVSTSRSGPSRTGMTTQLLSHAHLHV